ncbi:hypothetical protein M9434_006327 [Picochlorum sp. BPE23]|nr:hypothetical protein M9434_006327 [Picochlorum sp. BPE23]KAI8108973.1 hypothetical protein M9435_005390 [Picochlorum sp. BPE23]
MMSMVAPVTALPVVGGRRATRRGRSLVSVRAMSQETTSKSLEIMRKFSEQYAKRSGTYFCMDKHYDDKQAEADQGFWNCPCVPMRERKECHCMLFLTEDNDFRGDEQEITIDEVVQMTEGM